MKKVIYVLLFVLLSCPSWAVCDTGFIEYGRNGRCYCRNYGRSDAKRLSFFAGLAWCDAQAADGLSRSDIHSACDYDADHKWDSSKPTVCPNFSDTRDLRDSKGDRLWGGARAVGTLTSDGKVYRVNIDDSNNTGSVPVREIVTYDTLGWFWCNVRQDICDSLKGE